MPTEAPIRTTLPGKFYTDPTIFRAEMDRLFASMWVCVGRSEQISRAGEYLVAEVAGESLIIVRDGSLARAFFNVCRHRGTRICESPQGAFAGRIQCPYHAWTYGLDGRLLAAPHMDDVEGFSKDAYALHGVGVGEWDGHLFVNLSPDRQTMAEQLRDLPAKFAPWRMGVLRMTRRITYEVKANWKLIILNYNECLHCPVLHPALNRLHHYLGADNESPQPTYIGGAMGFRPGVETMSLDGKRRRGYLPGLEKDDCERVHYYAIYPNLLLTLHPDYMMTCTIWPKAPDHTTLVCEWHFHPDEIARPGFECDDAIEFWDITNKEDWRISELSQLGISSRAYRPGPYSNRELLLHAFDEWVRGTLGELPSPIPK